MARRLKRPAAAPRPARIRRRAAWLALIVAVAVVHLVATRELADNLASLDPAEAMPKRIEVAYVRMIEPHAPPEAVAPPAPARKPRVTRARRAPHPAAHAASAPEAAAAVVAAASAPAAARSAPAEFAAAEAAPAEPTASSVASSEQDANAFASAGSAASAVAAAAAASAPAAVLAAATAAASSSAGAAPFEWPSSTRVSYTLTGNYRGPVTGNAQVEWIRVGDRYQVNLDLLVGPAFAPLITRHMMSEGNIAASGLVPARYDEETQVVMRDRRRVTVVLGPDAVVLANGDRHERADGVQDTASQFIQLTYVFSTEPQRLRVGNTVAFPLALPRAIDSYVYEVVEEQTLQTPFGPLDAFHLKPQPRPNRNPNQLTAELWIAPELRYLPVRIRISQDPTTYIDLMIAGKPEAGEPTDTSSFAVPSTDAPPSTEPPSQDSARSATR